MIFKKNIFNYLKYILFSVVFMSMSVQNSSIPTIYIFLETSSELTEVDWEEETDDEEDKKEKEIDDEKTEPKFNIYNAIFYAFNTVENILIQPHFWEFKFDIHTPPPDLVA